MLIRSTSTISGRGISARRREVGERVDGLVVDADLEVQVRAGAPSGASDVADECAARDDAAAGGGSEARLVRVAGLDGRSVLKAGVEAVAGDGASGGDAAGRGGED